MRYRNHHHNSKPVHHVTPKVDDERIPPRKVVVINIPVTFKPLGTPQVYPTVKIYLTQINSTSWNNRTTTTTVRDADRKIAHTSTRRVSNNAGRKILTPDKEVGNDKDRITDTKNIDTPLRHHHHIDEQNLDDDILKRTIKITMPVTFKEPIPTLSSKKINDNNTKVVNDEKTNLDKKPGKYDSNVLIKIVATSYQVTYLTPEQTQEVIREQERKKKREESAQIAFEKRKSIALTAARARLVQRQMMAAKQEADKKSLLFKNTTVSTIATKKAELLQNSTFLIT